MSKMLCALIQTGDERWAEALRCCPHEFYHWPGYAVIEARRTKGTAVALYAAEGGRRFLLPLIALPWSDKLVTATDGQPRYDATSPYGFAGPLVIAPEPEVEAFVERVLPAAQDCLRREGIVSVFVRLNPLNPIPMGLARLGFLVRHGPCYWIDLRESAEQLRQQMRPRFRSYLNSVTRCGARCRFLPPLEGLENLLGLYYRTMERVGAASWYYFDRNHLASFISLLGAGARLCVVEQGQERLAAGLFAVSGGVVQYLLAGRDEDVGSPHATKLMLTFMRDWAKQEALEVFNLGGGLGASEDTLSQFKRGFTSHSSPYHTWRMIVDEDQYAGRLRAWEQLSGVAADGMEGYFPAYRKPFPQSEPIGTLDHL